MTYRVKEMFYTLQGEGGNAGRAAVFCRFSGCNLWSGLEKDRAQAVCSFCDTDFVGQDGVGGGRFGNPADLAQAVAGRWPSGWSGAAWRPLVVCTGGEPLLQLDESAIQAFHASGFEVAVETNGTRLVPPGVDWVCVSPKAGAELVVRSGDELKLVYPQADLMPDELENLDFQHFFLQPMDGPNQEANVQATVRYCLEHPRWRLSLQTHKIVGID